MTVLVDDDVYRWAKLLQWSVCPRFHLPFTYTGFNRRVDVKIYLHSLILGYRGVAPAFIDGNPYNYTLDNIKKKKSE